MFSPAEYLTNLNQMVLLQGLVTPRGQLPQIPSMPKMSGTIGIPVITTVPSTFEQCNDLIQTIGSSPLVLGLAASLASGLILYYLVKKHGPVILQWIRKNMYQFVASIKRRLRLQRKLHLLPGSQSVVMVWWFTEQKHTTFIKQTKRLLAQRTSGWSGGRSKTLLVSPMTFVRCY